LAVHCGNDFDAGLPRYKRRGDCDLLRVSRDREHGFHCIVSKYFAGS
jgi:hypothetical protein